MFFKRNKVTQAPGGIEQNRFPKVMQDRPTDQPAMRRRASEKLYNARIWL